MATKKQDRVFIFKVALKGAKRIWRRIAILGRQTLDDLHWAIYDAFDRDDEHLYAFYFLRPGARGRDRLRGAIEFSHPMVGEDPFADDIVQDATKAKIAVLKLAKRRVFESVFDFGDNWEHELMVEQTDG